MLIIRPQQMALLTQQSMRNRLFRHANQSAPQLCAQMSAEELHAVIDYCLARCRHYGITGVYDVLRYMNLMLVFGFTFDVDQPWAAQPLAYPNPRGRMDLLMDHALISSRRMESASHE
jgi:hypothetical protein